MVDQNRMFTLTQCRESDHAFDRLRIQSGPAQEWMNQINMSLSPGFPHSAPIGTVNTPVRVSDGWRMPDGRIVGRDCPCRTIASHGFETI